MGKFWRQCCGIKLSSSMITASRRCLEFWLPIRLYSTHNQQVYGRLKIKSGKFENIPLHKVPDVICVFTKFVHIYGCPREMPKKLRIDRGRQIVIEAPQLTYFHGFWQRGPCKARRCVCGLTSTYIFGFH